MKIYVMRHAEAVSPSEWSDDESRPLSVIGEAKMASAVQHMVRLGFSASRLLTSPYARTRQTAGFIEDFIPSLSAIVCPELASGASLSKMRSVVEKYKSDESIWIIGHMPDVAILSSGVTGEARMMERAFSPGEVVAIEIESTGSQWKGRVLWSKKLEEWEKAKEITA